jgi:hypothetical protein
LDFVRRRINDITYAAGTAVLPSVRQLAVADESGDGIVPAGSAVLVWHKGSRYLLTAAHVALLYPDYAYYLGTATKWVEIGTFFRVPAHEKARDHFDFAFCRVSDSKASAFDGCEFLTAQQIAAKDVPVFQSPYRSKYLALGYPLNRFKMNRATKTTTPKNLAYTGAIATPEQHRVAGFDPRTHVVMEYTPRAVVGPKGIQKSPKLVGLSGGGLFRLRSLESLHNASPPQLAGITIEQLPEKKLLVGVRLGIVFLAIDRDSDPVSAT